APLRLPCYDFAPVTGLTLDGCPLAVGPPVSGPSGFHGVTGGVYKARERIHRGVADPRLLAIPASCSRVADCNPNLARLLAIGSPSRVGDALYQAWQHLCWRSEEGPMFPPACTSMSSPGKVLRVASN